MGGKTVEQLKVEYSDLGWQRKYSAYCNLLDMLGDCIIADSYSLSDPLNAALALTKAGSVMKDRLIRKHGVNAKDANLMCALTLGHDELYIDVEAVNLDKLASAVSGEILEERIRFPFTHGRDLYDRFAEIFEEEKFSLTMDETIRLMDGMPIGVYQYGNYTIGPYGLQKSPVARSLKASTYVSAYHCAKSFCPIVHPAQLMTSRSAPINEDRSKLERVLQDIPAEAAEWWRLADDLVGSSDSYYRDERAGTTIPLIGDCLTAQEMQVLLAYLLDETKGGVRSAIAGFVEVGSAEKFVAGISRAHMLQLILFAREVDIVAALDHLVREDEIAIPVGEVRRPVVNYDTTSGAFRLRCELGSMGVRFVSDDPGFALLRERRLLNKLYLRDGKTDDIPELEWQLRGLDIPDLDERLEHFFRTVNPRSALERLVLARRTNMIAACQDAGLEVGDSLSDDELIGTLLWKLGFHDVQGDDPHREFWDRHQRVWALAQSSEIGASARFVEQAGPFFTQLEGILLDSLAFTTWALVTDHTTADAPYSYEDAADRAAGLSILDSAVVSKSIALAEQVSFASEKVTLDPLAQGFGILAEHLAEIDTNRNQYRRPDSELPEYHGKTELKAFLFGSTVPFLDLSAPSRSRIISGLREISKVLADAKVSNVRNDYLHYRRNPPDVERIELALEAARRAVTRIETLGFCRLLFMRSSVYVDRWGQSRHEYVGPRSYDHTLTRPSRYDWMSLPSLAEPQYLLRSASFGDQGEVLRFSRRFPSAYAKMWEAFPNRRRRGVGSATNENGGAEVSPAQVSSA